MDLGSVIGESGATALEMADDILVVSTPDVLSLRGVHRLTELWDRLGIRAEGSTRVLLNRVSRRNDLSPDAARKIVRRPVLDAVLAEETAGLEAAVNRRDPTLATAAWVKNVQTVSHELGTVPAPTLSSAPRRSRLSKKKGGGGEAPSAAGEDGRAGAPEQPMDTPRTTGDRARPRPVTMTLPTVRTGTATDSRPAPSTGPAAAVRACRPARAMGRRSRHRPPISRRCARGPAHGG